MIIHNIKIPKLAVTYSVLYHAWTNIEYL